MSRRPGGAGRPSDREICLGTPDMTHRRPLLASRLASICAVLLLAGLVPMAHPALAAPGAKEFAGTLAADERKLFEDWLSARATFDFKTDAYWREVDNKRVARKRKKAAGRAPVESDYVMSFPPAYAGPELTPDLAKRWEAFKARKDEERNVPLPEPKPGVDDFLAAARAEFDFVPERISEREFKRRYAREALALGLSKEQVVRIYALETSGLGTADMVAGIHPLKRTGTPISSAIGYAQLLAANSVSELVTSGNAFIDRLRHLSTSAAINYERAALLIMKIEAMKKMTAAAKSIPNKWDNHMAYARTAKGMGIHAVNLDGDIGPWLQVIKLKGLKEAASKRGLDNLSGSEIELMNLAGPGTGLEMMRPAGLKAPTPNFFERQAYARNTIVRGKTSAELIAALDQRMNENIVNAGAVEFIEVFDEIAAERQAAR